jgi:hypothetical protein
MGAANSTTKSEVLIRAAKLLEAKLPAFACRIFPVIDDDIPQSLQNNEVLTVQVTGGQFDYGAMVGGSSSVVHYQGTLRVLVWSSNRVDRPGVSLGMLTLPGRGLFILETKIIKALTGSYLQEVEAGGDGFTPNLIDSIKPLSDTQPQSAGEKGTAGAGQKASLAIDFSVDFKWDLDGDSEEGA